MPLDKNKNRRSDRIAIVAQERPRLEAAELVAVIEHFGVSGPAIAAARRELLGRPWRLLLLKNTLARRAIADTALAGLAPLLSGPTLLLVADAESEAALRWLVKAVDSGFRWQANPEWERYRSEPSAYRQQWLAKHRNQAGNWSALPAPGSQMRLKGAWAAGRALSAAEAREEASLSREALYQRLLCVLQASSQRLAALLHARAGEVEE